MSEAVQASIFDPFFTTKVSGRGLGLAAVKGIVLGHAGSISVRSQLGQGTTFQILLPGPSEPASKRGLPHLPAAFDPAEQIPGRTTTILVVDDEETLRIAISKLLNKRGFSTLQAADGSAAIDLFRTHQDEIDLILLDLTIPPASGREVLAEVRAMRPAVKVILTTAYSREIAIESLGGAPVDGFIRKPYQIGDLLRILQATGVQ